MNNQKIDKIINKELNIHNNDEKNKEINDLKKEIKILKNKIEYVDANIKANYITFIFVIQFYILSNLINFEKIFKISNNFSLLIFIFLISIFFYKENKILSKNIIKKLFIKS